MCGWVGLWESGSERDLTERVGAMADTLKHRGPDDSGTWADPDVGVGLGFRRLSILDLSAEGHQPMCSESGRYVIAFNGEVYNFAELRRRLEPRGCRFRGYSDTEVMLGAIEEYGLEQAVREFVGMFAFALWDRSERQLSLVRDRLGVKPLYYGWMGQTMLCGSELKALRAHPSFQARIDRGALSLYLRHQYVPAPHTIYQRVFKLPPGCILTLPFKTASESPYPYWSMRKVVTDTVEEPWRGSEQNAIDRLDELLRVAVGMRMVADVPLGAFLSGGVDSSTVVALMQAQSSRPVKTFSIGFAEGAYDEARHARAVAQHLGTDHTELYVSPDEARAVIPKLPDMYDEPFADSSQIPTYLVSQLARNHVTVSLSGDGGDELFGGYSWYTRGEAVWGKLGWVPARLRRRLGVILQHVEASTYDRWLRSLSPYAARYGNVASIGEKVHTVADSLMLATPDDLYRKMVSVWASPTSLVAGGHEPATTVNFSGLSTALDSLPHRMMYADTMTYLPDDILVKLDRASMAVGLEARVPLLDHRVAEFAWGIPLPMKIRDGEGKWILRQVLHRYVPPVIVDRAKMGFGVPIDQWLRGPLRTWAEDLLDEDQLRGDGFFDPEPIHQMWQRHISGAANVPSQIWVILMFQAWLNRWSR
jgi:asparagine synthase (glutamine-hydrolysing)